MNDIKILSKYKFYIKTRMDKELMYTAGCLYCKYDAHGIYCDVRVLNPIALKHLLDATCVYMQRWAKDRYNSVLSQIRLMYKSWKQEWIQKYRPQDLYSDVGKTMWKHQMEELFLSFHHKTRMLAFEMGTGKTLTAASITKLHGFKRTLVVCPNIVKWNWYKDLTGPDGWGFDELTFTILDARKTINAMLDEQFVITNYEMLKKEEIFRYVTRDPIEHIIVDESHYIKNEKSGRHKALKAVIDEFPKAKVTLLSGTPISNRVMDLFGQCRMASHPLGKNKHKFRTNYAKGKRGKITGIKNPEKLRLNMSNLWNIKKSVECQDLPELRIEKYYIQQDSYQDEYNEYMEQLHQSDREYKHLTLRIKNLESTVDKSDPELKELRRERFKLKGKMKNNINTINRITSMSKLNSVYQIIDLLLEQGHKVVVFGSYTDPLKAVTEHYKGRSVYIAGSVATHERERRIEAFKQDPNIDVFVGQVIAAGIGINLVNSTKCLFLNFPFTPDLIEQPQKRLHRGGQKMDVDVIYTICEGTIDEYIYNMIASKGNDINEIVNKDKDGAIDYGKIQEKMIGELLKDKYGESALYDEQQEQSNERFVKV